MKAQGESQQLSEGLTGTRSFCLPRLQVGQRHKVSSKMLVDWSPGGQGFPKQVVAFRAHVRGLQPPGSVEAIKRAPQNSFF